MRRGTSRRVDQEARQLLTALLRGIALKMWAVPMSPDSKVIHMGDIAELGDVVAGAFTHRDKVGSGQHLALAGDLVSWSDIALAREVSIAAPASFADWAREHMPV